MSIEHEDDEREKGWVAGHRAAWVGLLQTALRELGYEGTEAEHARWIVEREAAVVALRNVCETYGDNEWPDNLRLADVIEKHLERHLDAEYESEE